MAAFCSVCSDIPLPTKYHNDWESYVNTRTGTSIALNQVILVFALQLSGASAPAVAQDPAPHAPVTTAAPAPAPPASVPAAINPAAAPGLAPVLPPLKTICVAVSDAGLFNSLFEERGEAGINPVKSKSECVYLIGTSGVLNGSGDLTIAVDQKNFEAFSAAKRDQPGGFVLFLNGVALMTDARLIAQEQVESLAVLRYRISQGKETQLLWSMLYANHGFEDQHLYAAIGWKGDSETMPAFVPARDNTGARVRVTTVPQLLLALGLVALAIGVVIYIGRHGDSLRDADLPSWWLDATELKAAIANMDPAKRDKHILAQYAWYVTEDAAEYQRQAESVLSRQPFAEKHVPTVTVGLALLVTKWTPIRASYSLSRTQLALWFTFTVSTGVFLWMLYGDLRRIDGSLLTLLGISVGTAGLSWLADRNLSDRPYSPSQGFLADILTGFDERKQLHRYQAVIVNLLLLLVGVFHVGQQLTYPVFDPSWLIFLGISGSAYGIGKGVIETK